jgi:G3E family GTPase
LPTRSVLIDDAIFAQTPDSANVLLLANGCLCCAAGDDLVKTVLSLTRREVDRPRRVVIETSGLADPVSVLFRLVADPGLAGAVRVAGVVTTIDAVNGGFNLDGHPVALRQAAIADRRIVTKSDLVDPLSVAALTVRLTDLNPGSSIRVVSHGAMEATELFATSMFDPHSGSADPDAWMSVEAYRLHRAHGRRQPICR